MAETEVIETRSDRKWRERIMTLEEYALAKARDEIIKEKDGWFAEGKAEGKVEGKLIINALIQRLIEDGRLDDLKRSSEDEEYQEKLIKEYGLGE